MRRKSLRSSALRRTGGGFRPRGEQRLTLLDGDAGHAHGIVRQVRERAHLLCEGLGLVGQSAGHNCVHSGGFHPERSERNKNIWDAHQGIFVLDA
jgi:hypothetical protein